MTGLFKNSADAITFALEFSFSVQSSMAKLQPGVIGNGKGLVAENGSAQAGLILSAMGCMDPMRLNCIKARYAPKFKKCVCCGGDQAMDGWRDAIKVLAQWSTSTFSGLSNATVREAIIMDYFEQDVSMADAAKLANVPVKTVYNQRAKIFAALRVLDEAAQQDIEDILQSRNLVV